MYRLLRSALFCLDAETAHHLTLSTLKSVNSGVVGRKLAARMPSVPVDVMGIRFPNPVGLSAGLDKNGDYIHGLANLGFGFVEIGTVTPFAQPGNDRPRIFRIPERKAIINRMGFNNKGLAGLLQNLDRADFKGVLGINIGKNLSTPVDRAVDDYVVCMEKVYGYASYITVNVSSPNTPGLRSLQHGQALRTLFVALKDTQRRLSDQYGRYVPLAIKIAPDLEASEVQEVADAVLKQGIDAVIATNTTNSREGVGGFNNSDEKGGLSGAPLTRQSTAIVRQLFGLLGDDVPVIAVGGIMSGADAVEKIEAGARLVQIYSGLIYRGPALIKECVEAMQPIAAFAKTASHA